MKKVSSAPSDPDEQIAQEKVFSEVKEALRGIAAKQFEYFWKNRGRVIYGHEILHKALGHRAASYSAAAKKKTETQKKSDLERTLSPKENQKIRQQCKSLADKLRDYFEGSTNGWVIALPPGGPNRGYQLECYKLNDPNELTHAFWAQHLNAPGETSIVYVEQLFYQNWNDRLVFRYYDCNAERSVDALKELKERHPSDPHATDPVKTLYSQTPEVNAIYPYVAWGEVGARDVITSWFAKHAHIEIKTLVSRRLNYGDFGWDASLILFGTGSGNRFIEETLASYPDLDIRLEQSLSRGDGYSGKVFVANPCEAELKTFARYKPVKTSHGYTIEFNPSDEKALAIFTRVPNPHSTENVVSIFNSDFGRAIEQMARVVTTEKRLLQAKKQILKEPLTEYYQVLCAVPTRRSEHLENHIDLLALRPYHPKGV